MLNILFAKNMNWVKTVAELSKTNEEERNYLAHEFKYALLGAILFIILIIPGVDSLIRNTFPAARAGPMIFVYKVALFIAIFYIIQKTDWFQNI